MSDDQVIATALLGRPIDHLILLARGGNNRLYRVASGGSVFAMKLYEADDPSGRQRFERETVASRFLSGTKLADRVPLLIATDRASSAALFEWIAGEPPTERNTDEIEQMLDFISELNVASALSTARHLGAAAEACLSPAELRAQIDRRRARLGEISDEPFLSTYLGRFDHAWHLLRPTLVETEALALEFQVLSPSDFGFHNALRRPNGRLAFLDFEYCGWDDPVKLTADILWHPGMTLRDDEASALQIGLTALFGRHDRGFARRLAYTMPAYGLRWCLILLNEFLPERWGRRRLAQDVDMAEWTAAKRRQLAKAEHLIARIETCHEEILQ
jgi:hypothetical protein